MAGVLFIHTVVYREIIGSWLPESDFELAAVAVVVPERIMEVAQHRALLYRGEDLTDVGRQLWEAPLPRWPATRMQVGPL